MTRRGRIRRRLKRRVETRPTALDHDDTGLALAADLAGEGAMPPTVILSADGGASVRRAVHEAGLTFLTKPLKPLALKSTLDRLLAAERRGLVPSVSG